MGVMPTAFATRRMVTASEPSRSNSLRAAAVIRFEVEFVAMYTAYTKYAAYTTADQDAKCLQCPICPSAVTGLIIANALIESEFAVLGGWRAIQKL